MGPAAKLPGFKFGFPHFQPTGCWANDPLVARLQTNECELIMAPPSWDCCEESGADLYKAQRVCLEHSRCDFSKKVLLTEMNCWRPALWSTERWAKELREIIRADWSWPGPPSCTLWLCRWLGRHWSIPLSLCSCPHLLNVPEVALLTANKGMRLKPKEDFGSGDTEMLSIKPF